MQTDLFDPIQAERNKHIGMQQAAKTRAKVLTLARRVAIEIAKNRKDGVCHADLVQKELGLRGILPHQLGNAAGSIFRGKNWEWTGHFIKSERTTSNQRIIRVWQFIGD